MRSVEELAWENETDLTLLHQSGEEGHFPREDRYQNRVRLGRHPVVDTPTSAK